MSSPSSPRLRLEEFSARNQSAGAVITGRDHVRRSVRHRVEAEHSGVLRGGDQRAGVPPDGSVRPIWPAADRVTAFSMIVTVGATRADAAAAARASGHSRARRGVFSVN